MTLQTENFHYSDRATALTGVFAWDDSLAGKRPGVLVVHGGAGLDEHARERAGQIAGWGYVAFACDMYGSGVMGNRERVMAQINELRADPARLCARAQAGVDALASHPSVDGRLAAVGYCFGGMTVLELARSGVRLAGVASIHGTLSTNRPADPGALKAKILVCHGALDPHVPMTQVNSFAEEMNRAGADWQLVIYGRALHGFTHKGTPSIPGVAYDALADARSSIVLRNFFRELFG